MAQVWVHCLVNHGNGLVGKGMGESTAFMRRVRTVGVGATDGGEDCLRTWPTHQCVLGEQHGDDVPVPDGTAQDRHGTQWQK
jgi:hypothetical protein